MTARRFGFIIIIILTVIPLWQPSVSHSLPPPTPQDSDFTLDGKITEKSGGRLTVSSTDNIIFHVIFSSATEIKRTDGSAGTEADLQLGINISVAGTLAENGEITAKKIEIRSAEKH